MVKLISEYLDLIITILTSIGIIIGLLGQLFKNKKMVKASEKLEIYTKLVQEYVVKAEQFDKLSGKEKLNYVIKQVTIELSVNGIEIDEALIKQLVENIIELSKNVNYKK